MTAKKGCTYIRYWTEEQRQAFADLRKLKAWQVLKSKYDDEVRDDLTFSAIWYQVAVQTDEFEFLSLGTDDYNDYMSEPESYRFSKQSFRSARVWMNKYGKLVDHDEPAGTTVFTMKV